MMYLEKYIFFNQIKIFMKKMIFLLVIIILQSIAFSSCKNHKICDGYYNQTEETSITKKETATTRAGNNEGWLALSYLDILPKLYLLGITPADSLQLEVFIRSVSYKNALELSEQTYWEKGFDMKVGCTDSTTEGLMFSGWTNKIKMDSATVLALTKELLTLCSNYGCTFKGWGAIVQPERGNDVARKVTSDSAVTPEYKR